MKQDLKDAQNFHRALIGILKKGRIAFVGVGNTMCSDDGVGSYIASCLKQKLSAVIDAGQMPENYIGAILRLKPDAVVLIDALDFNARPGQAKALKAEKVNDTTISTHGMSLKLFTQQLKQLLSAEVFLIGVQPYSVVLGEGLSRAVKAAADEIIEIICTKQ